MSNAVPITVLGEKKLRDELELLKTVKRPSIIAAIAEARAHGDLKENAEYHAAREEQAFVEGRIQDIENTLANCHVIDVSKIHDEGKVVFGATVTLLNVDVDAEVTYQIVGIDEADIKENKISITSPTARAMIGKPIGDVVTVKTPTKAIDYEIIAIELK